MIDGDRSNELLLMGEGMEKTRDLNVQSEDDILLAIAAARQMMKPLPFSKVDEQKVLVSVSELTRNLLDHAGQGVFRCEMLTGGICLKVFDKGPGITQGNLYLILNGKRSASQSGLGLGLSGVKRLMDEFYIETSKGGTKIIAIKWKDKQPAR
jgi:serine/threonine-protein kinase RsbT